MEYWRFVEPLENYMVFSERGGSHVDQTQNYLPASLVWFRRFMDSLFYELCHGLSRIVYVRPVLLLMISLLSHNDYIT